MIKQSILSKSLRARYWSPYLAGIILGLLQIPIFLSLHASIGASNSVYGVSCLLLSAFQHDAHQCFPPLKHWWQLAFVLGIAIGAYLSARLSRSRREPISPVWLKKTCVSSVPQRMIMAFVGGFMLFLGARIADGCTSGNGLSGVALLSIGSLIVTTSLFVAGILFVRLYRR